MIVSNCGYSIVQDAQKNEIVITLPSSFRTTSDIGDAKHSLTEAEEAAILSFVMQFFGHNKNA